MFKRFLAILLCLLLVVPVALADGLSVGAWSFRLLWRTGCPSGT